MKSTDKSIIIAGIVLVIGVIFSLLFKLNVIKNNDKEEYETLTNNKITIAFNGNGGSVSRTRIYIKKGSKIGNLPTANRKGYDFIGWYTNTQGGIRMYSNSVFYSSMTLYAHWREKPVEVKSIKLNRSNLSMMVGSTNQLSVTINPNNATNKSIMWTTSNTNIATVDGNGLVRAKSVGTTTITAISSNGKKASCRVTITSPIYASKVTLNKSSININTGSTAKLTATISPSNTTNKSVYWSSSNSNVASVDQTGQITAKNEGTTTIKVRTSNGKEATCKVTVKNVKCRVSSDPIDANYNSCFKYSHSLNVSTSSISLKVGESKSIYVTLPKECGTLIQYTRTSADGNPKWQNYVSQSRANIGSNGFTWIITGKKKGSTVVSQTVQYDAKSPSGKCSGNVKTMITVNVTVK